MKNVQWSYSKYFKLYDRYHKKIFILPGRLIGETLFWGFSITDMTDSAYDTSDGDFAALLLSNPIHILN